MSSPTPYDGSAKPFQIGIKPLDPADWIDVDAHLAEQLGEKHRILATHPAATFVAEPDTGATQSELLEMLAAHLPARFPNVYRRQGNRIEILPTGVTVDLDAAEPPLLIAAQLVQEDLILLRRAEAGWRLVAGALAFPSGWVLTEKFGLPMHEVHSPVPGFGAGTRPAQLIERMFDNLRPDMPLIRWNWSLFGDDALYHPHGARPGTRRFGAAMEAVFLRVERQTLRRLQTSGDIVFTIRIYVDPLEALERQADAAQLAAALAGQLQALDASQLDYKGLTEDRDRLLTRLAKITAPL